MTKYIVDLEGNGLLDTIDTVWCMVMKDIVTGDIFSYSDHSTQSHILPMSEGLERLQDAKVAIGHNFILYDSLVLAKIYPKYNFDKVQLIDTLLISKLSYFSRPLKFSWGRHSLEVFGQHFGRFKPVQKQWLKFEEAMIHRCEEDVEINYLTYKYLQRETALNHLSPDVLYRELNTALISRKQVQNGWRLDIPKAHAHLKTLDKNIKNLAKTIEPNLPMTIKKPSKAATWEEINEALGFKFKKVPPTRLDVRGKIEKPAKLPNLPKYTKKGIYHSSIIQWFNLPKNSGQLEDTRFVLGPYTKVEFSISRMSQHAQVKKFLFKQGWIPTTWNYKKDASGNFLKDSVGRKIKTSPKLTEDSYDSIKGALGKQITVHNTYASRRKVIENVSDNEKGWLNNLAPGDKVICTPQTIGAATARMIHSGLVNVPSTKAVFGKEMRELFIATDGYQIVACDMSSAQLRLLAVAMGDKNYIKAVVLGTEATGTDVHSINGLAAGLIDPAWKPGSKEWSDGRSNAKTFIYALLFGAGDAKIGTIVGGGLEEGRALRSQFLETLPSLEKLINKLKKEWLNNKKAGEGWFKGLDGRRIYCNSPHKILNFKLQSDEAILLKQWLINVDMAIEESTNVNSAKLLLSYHDELNYEAIPSETQELGAILTKGIQDAGKQFDIDIMDGNYKVGPNWAEVH